MLKNLLNTIKSWVLNFWTTATKKTEALLPAIIDVVNEIKNINESSTGDIIEVIIEAAFGKPADIVVEAIRAKLKTVLPKAIMVMNISVSIANIKDPNEQLKAILVAINMSPDETKNTFYHDFCFHILLAASDGKVTWSESIVIAEEFFTKIYPTLKK